MIERPPDEILEMDLDELMWRIYRHKQIAKAERQAYNEAQTGSGASGRPSRIQQAGRDPERDRRVIESFLADNPNLPL